MALLTIVALVAALFTKQDDGMSGIGTFQFRLASDAVVEHRVEVPKDSILLVEIRPSRGLDPDVGAVTSRPDARRLEGYLADTGYSLDGYDGAFDDYEPHVTGQAIARVDEFADGLRERLVVTAPKGGRFGIVVGAAAGTSGSFELEVTRRRFNAHDRGDDYIAALVDNPGVRRFLDNNALSELDAFGGMNLVFTGDDTSGDRLDAQTLGDELGGDIDVSALSCVADRLSSVLSEDEMNNLLGASGPETSNSDVDTKLAAALQSCGVDPNAFP